MIKRLTEYGNYYTLKDSITGKIKELQEELICLQEVKISQLSGMPHNTGVSDVSANCALKSIEVRENIAELKKDLKIATEKYENMGKLIERLTEEQRKIIKLRFVDKRPWEEIADFLGYNQTYIFCIQSKIANKLVELAEISFL